MCIDFHAEKPSRVIKIRLAGKKTKTKPNINIALDWSYLPTTIIANIFTNAKLVVNSRKINPH